MIDRDVRSIAARTPDDPAALRLLARHSAAMGDVQMDRAMHGLGTLARRAAVDAYERLHALTPGDIALEHERSIAIVKLGDALHLSGDLPAALERFREALALDLALAEKHPENIPILSNLYWSCRRAESWDLMGDPVAREAMRERSLAVASEMMRLAPTQWRSIEAAAASETQQAIIAARAGDLPGALDRRLAALELARRMAASDTQHKQGQALLVRSLLTVAQTLAMMGRAAESESLLVEADSALAGLAGPGADEYHRLIYGGALEEARSGVAASLGDYSSALRWAKLAASTAGELRERYPGDIECHSTTITRLAHLAQLHLREGQRAELRPIAEELRRIATYCDERFKSRTHAEQIAANCREIARRIDAALAEPVAGGALTVSDRSGGMSNADLALWEVLDDHSAGADERVGPDGDAGPDEGVGADPDIVSDGDWRPQQR